MIEPINWKAVAKAEQHDNERLRGRVTELEGKMKSLCDPAIPSMEMHDGKRVLVIASRVMNFDERGVTVEVLCDQSGEESD